MKKVHKSFSLLLSLIILFGVLTVFPAVTASAEAGDTFNAHVNGRWVMGEKQPDENGSALFRFAVSELSDYVIFCRVNPAAVEGFDELTNPWAADVVWNQSADLWRANGNVCYLHSIENGIIRASWTNQNRQGGYLYVLAQEPVKNDGAVICVWTYSVARLTEHEPRAASYDEETGEVIPGCPVVYYTALWGAYFIDDGKGGYKEIAEEELFTVMPDDGGSIRGDADSSGTVEILDATAIQRYLASFSVNSFDETAADADANGEVSILDATFIQRYLASYSCPDGIGKPISSFHQPQS